MNNRKLATLVCTLIVCVAYGGFAQNQTQPTQKPNPPGQEVEKLVVGTNEVLLDAVVRDKKGRAVKDLQSSDFEIYEDGVRQDVKSFRFVREEPGSASSSSRSSSNQAETKSEKSRTVTPAPPISNPRTIANISRVGAVAMVFDRLSPEARTIARQAALSYIKDGLRA